MQNPNITLMLFIWTQESLLSSPTSTLVSANFPTLIHIFALEMQISINQVTQIVKVTYFFPRAGFSVLIELFFISLYILPHRSIIFHRCLKIIIALLLLLITCLLVPSPFFCFLCFGYSPTKESSPIQVCASYSFLHSILYRCCHAHSYPHM